MRVEVLMTNGSKHVFEQVASVGEGSGHTIEIQLRVSTVAPISIPREYIAGIDIDI